MAALAAAGARQRAALPADPALRLAEPDRGRAGAAEGPARISAESCASTAASPSPAAYGIDRDDALSRSGRDLHRRRLQRQSRARRLGRDPALSRRSRRSCRGGEAPTTNNRMELMAAIAALEALKRPCRVQLYTDSQYLRDGITRWLPRLEGARLAHRRQEAGQERRSVAAPRCRRRAASGRMALGAGHAGHPKTSAPTRSPAPRLPRRDSGAAGLAALRIGRQSGSPGQNHENTRAEHLVNDTDTTAFRSPRFSATRMSMPFSCSPWSSE